jgi:hypothetical protein
VFVRSLGIVLAVTTLDGQNRRTRIVGAEIPKAQRTAVEQLAAERGVRISDIVREALSEYIERQVIARGEHRRERGDQGEL